jgi:hypothetical protein
MCLTGLYDFMAILLDEKMIYSAVTAPLAATVSVSAGQDGRAGTAWQVPRQPAAVAKTAIYEMMLVCLHD